MNILKAEALADKGFYSRVHRQFGFERVWAALLGGAAQYRFFTVRIEGREVLVEPTQSVRFLHMVNTLGPLLPLAARAELLEVLKPKTFRGTNKKAILCHLHADWVLPLAALKHPDTLTPAQKEGLLEYLRRTVPGDDFDTKFFRATTSPEARSNMHTFNKDSVLVDLEDFEQSRHVSRLGPKQLTLIRQTRILRHIEVTDGFDARRLTSFLTELQAASDLILKTYPNALAHRVALKLRKIRRTHKTGVYVVATGTALVDPRHTDSFWHELGHWVHSWAHPELTELAACEAFAEEFQGMITGKCGQLPAQLVA